MTKKRFGGINESSSGQELCPPNRLQNPYQLHQLWPARFHRLLFQISSGCPKTLCQGAWSGSGLAHHPAVLLRTSQTSAPGREVHTIMGCSHWSVVAATSSERIEVLIVVLTWGPGWPRQELGIVVTASGWVYIPMLKSHNPPTISLP